MPSETDLDARKEVTRWRAIMYQPSGVWLATDMSGERWLTDEYVMLNVTDSPALASEDEAHSWGVLPDGPYKLMASGELRIEEREGTPAPDLERYFMRLDEIASWREAVPTEWSVAEHPGKAMLWTSLGKPCLLGESTWTAIKRRYPNVSVDYGHGALNIFRFSTIEHHCPEEEDGCECPSMPFCFAAGIQVPEGQEDIAAIVAHHADDA